MAGKQEYLIRAKGIYDSDLREMNDTGMVIRDDVIRERGKFEELVLRYPAVEILDFSEEFILPGLINTHVHLEFTPSEGTYQAYMAEDTRRHMEKAEQAASQLVRSGVTAVRDAGSSMELVEMAKKWDVPRIQCSGVPLTVSGGHLGFLGRPADSAEELEKAVRERYLAGCGCIKIIASGGQMTPGSLPEQDSYSQEQIEAAVGAAHKFGLLTAAHCLTTTSYVNAMKSGVDSIEHCACFVRNQKWGLLERRFEPEAVGRFCGDHRFFMIGFSNNYHRLDRFRQDLEWNRHIPDKEGFLLEQEEKEAEIFRRLIQLGMRPTVGTDAGCGLTYFDETWLEVELLVKRCGITNQEAIHAATAAGAEALGWGDFLGKLKVGYQADFITMKQNPLQDIRALKQVNRVFCKGRCVK